MSPRRLLSVRTPLVDRIYPERWQYDIVVTQSGRYHLSCESDAQTLPTKAVVAQLRKTVTVDLELDD